MLRPVPSDRIILARKAEPSAAVAARVLKAREVQNRRFSGEAISVNAEMNNKQIEHFCPLSEECLGMMSKLMTRLGLSMRAYFRIIRVARTIADLEGSGGIDVTHLVEAAGFRFLDRQKY